MLESEAVDWEAAEEREEKEAERSRRFVLVWRFEADLEVRDWRVALLEERLRREETCPPDLEVRSCPFISSRATNLTFQLGEHVVVVFIFGAGGFFGAGFFRGALGEVVGVAVGGETVEVDGVAFAGRGCAG
jgi:hypothetical protein